MEMELRADGHLHISGYVNVTDKTPVYAATSVEIRANDETEELECRTFQSDITVKNQQKKQYNSDFKERLEKIKLNQ